MSETLLKSKNKFNACNPEADEPFNETQFFKWSENNFYRTSTNDMHISHVSSI